MSIERERRQVTRQDFIIAVIVATIGGVASGLILLAIPCHRAPPECLGVAIEVDEPRPADRVGLEFNVRGHAQIQNDCRIIYVFIAPHGGGLARNWHVAGQAILQNSGQWSTGVNVSDANARLGQVDVQAVLVGDPNVYHVGTFLPSPPMQGSSSAIVTVERVR